MSTPAGIMNDVPRKAKVSADAVRMGAILRRHRLEHGWKLVELAERAGMNPIHLSTLEKGGNMPSIESLLVLATVFGVEAAEMLREFEQARYAARIAE